MESKERFIDGPWRVMDGRFIVEGKGDYLVASARPYTEGEEEPNAHLIAAAPELYECLKTACAECRVENSLEDEECRDCKVRKVLAKARGEEVEDADDDMVNHPAHYTSHPSGIECIQVTEWMDFCLGNAVKYIWRAGLKDPKTRREDLEKAVWYIKREMQRDEGQEARK